MEKPRARVCSSIYTHVYVDTYTEVLRSVKDEEREERARHEAIEERQLASGSSDPSDPMISVCVSWTHFSDTRREKKLIADV